MTGLPALTSKKLIKVFEKIGFEFIRQKGSHRIYRKDNRLIVIPYHTKDLKRPTVKSIIAQSGITVDEFTKYL